MNNLHKAVLGALALIVIVVAGRPIISGMTAKGHEASLEQKSTVIETALLDFFEHHGRFPSASEGFVVLELDNETFFDPRGGRFAYTNTSLVAELTSPGFPEWTLVVDGRPLMAEWIDRTRTELEAVAHVADRYRTESGVYPASLSDLDAALPGDRVRFDPWGFPYRIDPTRERPWSVGPDGEAGTADDVFPAQE